MNPRLYPLFPAAAILTAGIWLLGRQQNEVEALTSAAANPPPMAAPAGKNVKKAADRSEPSPVVPHVPESDRRATAFLERVQEKARPLVEKTAKEAASGRAGARAARIALLLGLSATETEALKAAIEKEQLTSEVAAATRAWIAENKGEAALTTYDKAEAARRTAGIEHDAQEAIFRLSRIIDVTPEQKDQLFAAFVHKADALPPQELESFEFRFKFRVNDLPSVGNASELARPLLTPEQASLMKASLAQEQKVRNESTAAMMTQLLPVFLSALQEPAEDDAPQTGGVTK